MAYLLKKIETYTQELEQNNITNNRREKLTEIIRVMRKQIEQIKPKLNND
jgi:coenzyme F420-reducing hydrogenase delta subunit